MNRLILLFFILSGVGFGACDTTNSSQEDPEVLAAKAKLLQADASFSIDLFKTIHAADSATKNKFISPLSVSMALGMTMNGTAGNTFAEMQHTLGFGDLTLQEINKGYKALQYDLEHADDKVEMNIANSVWSRAGVEVKPEFTSTLEEYFEAETASIDFNDPETINTINKWVAQKTNDRIKKIIEMITADDVMFLINAVYFNAPWKYEFDVEETFEMDFYVDENTSVSAEMMNQAAEVGHLINDEVEIVELPYGNNKFSAVFIKPGAAISDIDVLIDTKLSSTKLNEWISGLNVSNVGYFIPKLELEYKRQLIPDLQELGMTELFIEGNANLDNIFINVNNLYVSSVLHKTFLKMNEEGTEAAAVTAVTVTTESTGPSYPTIVYNEPYLLLLRERNTGAVLFMGKIGDPTAKE